MAMTGTLLADFGSFYEAVSKAETSLKSFESGAGQVEKSLNRMVDTFSGRKLIQDATLMVEAVERIGGVSKLTATELQRVAGVAAQASEKMSAMGLEVPDKIAAIASQVSKTSTLFGTMQSTVMSLAGAFGVTFSIAQIVEFGRAVLAAGDAFGKMAEQTGMSLQEVQKLQYIADQSNVAVTSLTGAIQTLQQRLGDPSSGAAAAV